MGTLAANITAPAACDELLATAERLFASGDDARAALAAVLAHPDAAPEHRAQARSDLAVIAWSAGRSADAERNLLEALAEDPTCVAACENLAELCRRAGDLVQAGHWARRWTELRPDGADAWQHLGATLMQRRRWRLAADALQRAARLGADCEQPLATTRRHLQDGRAIASHPDRQVTRVLIVVDFFHPSLGGSERLAEAAGTSLMLEGLTVGVATRALPERDRREHRGMTIHEIATDPVAALARIVAEHDYDAVLVFSAPTAWPVIAAANLPASAAHRLIVPCINEENSAGLASDPSLLAQYGTALADAEPIGVSSQSGADIRLAETLGLQTVYLPNASEEPAPDLRSRLTEIDGEGPLLLMVANLYPEKDHVGLLTHLADVPGDWRLVLIGAPAPAFPDVAGQVSRLVDADERATLIGAASPGAVAASMAAADLLLLPSSADATPIVLLEAMSRRLPWIATPHCGAANDHAGGVIAPVTLFGETISFLLDHADARSALGAAGREHWEACYRWPVMGPRYARVLRGEPVDPLDPPRSAIDATDSVRARFYDARPRRAL